jgi:hypothetical protein
MRLPYRPEFFGGRAADQKTGRSNELEMHLWQARRRARNACVLAREYVSSKRVPFSAKIDAAACRSGCRTYYSLMIIQSITYVALQLHFCGSQFWFRWLMQCSGSCSVIRCIVQDMCDYGTYLSKLGRFLSKIMPSQL